MPCPPHRAIVNIPDPWMRAWRWAGRRDAIRARRGARGIGAARTRPGHRRLLTAGWPGPATDRASECGPAERAERVEDDLFPDSSARRQGGPRVPLGSVLRYQEAIAATPEGHGRFLLTCPCESTTTSGRAAPGSRTTSRADESPSHFVGRRVISVAIALSASSLGRARFGREGLPSAVVRDASWDSAAVIGSRSAADAGYQTAGDTR